jgi:hypothetical protein
MARKSKDADGQSGDGVPDLRHTGVTRLNIPRAGIEARGEIVKEWDFVVCKEPTALPGMLAKAGAKK